MKKPALALLFALFAAVAASAARQPAWAPQVDAVFTDLATREAPGCALAVYRDGRLVYERGYGVADLEHDVPITPGSVFYVGSLSKQFTAFAVALAASEGKLSLDDEVRKWVPELPDYGSRLSVRHLLHHTSGLRDYNTLFDIAGRRNDEAFDNQIVLAIVTRQKALNFAPGEQYLYSNSGYVLLSIVVERATGTPLADYAKARIFQPLGMRDTQFYDDVTRVVKNRAFAYESTASGKFRDSTPHSQRTGAGGVLTTVRDLLAWDNNFYEPKVGTKALIAQLHETGTLNSGKALTYAYGLQIGQYRGQRTVEHGGSLGGYRAHLVRFPDPRSSVACLCNFSTSDPGGRARRVADVVLRGRFTESARPTTSDRAAEPQSNQIATHAGRVAAGRAGAGRVGAGRVGAGRIEAGRVGAGLQPGPIPSTSLEDYVGEYNSDELTTTFVFDSDGRSLRLKRERDATPTALRALAPDRFAFRGMVIRFQRENGRVIGLAVDAGRVQDIRFTRREAPAQAR